MARIMQATGDGSAQVSEWIIGQWIKENASYLAERFNIRPEQFSAEFQTVWEQYRPK